MNTAAKLQILRAARDNPTEEVCGLIVYGPHRVEARVCPNVSRDDKAHTFEIDPKDYIAAARAGIPCGVFHSHPFDEAVFTDRDIKTATALALPAFVCSLKSDRFETYVPVTYKVSLTSRPFAWGISDCYETIRIHFRQELSIYMPDYDRDEAFRHDEPNTILEQVENAGFRLVGKDLSQVQPHDVLIFNPETRRHPHHLGVFVGKSRMLHHPFGELSQISDLNEKWINKVTAIARHTSL